jgi:CRISPR-associated exonuclease Cas4
MIPINLIRQYHFCPRIVYFNLLTNIKPIYPRHVSLGEDYHKIQEKLSRYRRFKKLHIDFKEIIIDKYFEDKELEIVGKIDTALITQDEIIPIEFKQKSGKKPTFGHILQLYGYGYLLSKAYSLEFKQAFIFYDQNLKLHHINITQKTKDQFFKTLQNIKDILEDEIFPNSNANEAKCSQCEYINFCDDRI